jgi:hypothetical protein
MRKTVENQDGRNTGVKWTEDEALEDLHYADDLALVSEGSITCWRRLRDWIERPGVWG